MLKLILQMEIIENQLKSEIKTVRNTIESILQNDLGERSNGLLKFRGRISTDPLKTSKDLVSRDFYGMCGTFSSHIQHNSESIKFNQNMSAHPDGNGHVYLTTQVLLDQEIIVDASIGQFLDGHMFAFVGTRDQLKDIFLNQTGKDKPYKIVNTKSKDNPLEAFSRIYGDKSKIYGKKYY